MSGGAFTLALAEAWTSTGGTLRQRGRRARARASAVTAARPARRVVAALAAG
jgi:hypothetical protein